MKFQDYINSTNLAQALQNAYVLATDPLKAKQFEPSQYTAAANWLLNYCHRLKRLDVDNNTIADEDMQAQLLEVPCMQVERLMNSWDNFNQLTNLDEGKSHSQESNKGFQITPNGMPVVNHEVVSWNDYDVIDKQNKLLDKSNNILTEIYNEWTAYVWNS